MNSNIISVALLTVGGLLLWAAITNHKPLPAVKNLMGGEGNAGDAPNITTASYEPDQGNGTGESVNGGTQYA